MPCRFFAVDGTLPNWQREIAFTMWNSLLGISLKGKPPSLPHAATNTVTHEEVAAMASNVRNRILIDNSEFVEAVRPMLLRRESAAAAARRDIDRAIERLNDGDVRADQLRVYWHETTQEGDTIVHITAGPALLELALPSNEETD